MRIENREHWLNLILPFIQERFKAAGYEVPQNLRFTCGFPSKGALGAKKRRIGECWDSGASSDKVFEISVSPTLDDPIKVVGVQIHEVVHAVVGLKVGHKKPFAKCAEAVGLTKPWTATGESDELKEAIKGWVDRVGPYPHGALKPRHKEQGEKGRMLLMQCKCGLKVRTTQKWIDAYGESWPCPCAGELVAAEQE